MEKETEPMLRDWTSKAELMNVMLSVGEESYSD
jgi:hypothetical protein